MSASSSNLRMTGLGHCPLVLGECVQGQLSDGSHFLITSPLGIFSWAEFTPEPGLDQPVVRPPHCTKARSAVWEYLRGQGVPAGGRLRVSTPMESGQGFGTSTADIAASIRAAAAAWRRHVEPDEIARIAIGIEPTDGSMYPGCVAFGHRTGLLLEPLGEMPAFEAVVVLAGGTLDTVEFDRVRKHFRYTSEEHEHLRNAWEMVRHAIRQRDVAVLAKASTLSARINQKFLPKPFFRELHELVALGLVEGLMVAHSGTALALILDPAHADHEERLHAALELISGLQPPSWFYLSSRQRFIGRRHYRQDSGVAMLKAGR